MSLSLLIAFALQAAATPAVQPAATPDAAAEKPICRRETPVGSHLIKRVCHTKAQWATINATNAQDTDTALRQRQSRPGSTRLD